MNNINVIYKTIAIQRVRVDYIQPQYKRVLVIHVDDSIYKHMELISLSHNTLKMSQ